MHETPPNVPSSSADLDDWLRCTLGRRVNLAVIAVEDEAQRQVDTLTHELGAYTEIRVLPLSKHNTARATLQRTMQEDADVVFLWTEGSLDSEDIRTRLRQWQSEGEGLGLCDRAFVALIGAHVTMATARGLGYEDGIPAATTSLQLATLVANEAVARDEIRRRGSSPPCYL